MGRVLADKLAKNARKYPAEKCKRKSDKYSAYATVPTTVGKCTRPPVPPLGLFILSFPFICAVIH